MEKYVYKEKHFYNREESDTDSEVFQKRTTEEEKFDRKINEKREHQTKIWKTLKQ